MTWTGSGPTVRVRELVAGYRGFLGRRTVLEGVELDLVPGTVTGLVGLNGVGKTTLLRVLLGFLPAWRGQVSIDGHGPREYRRRHGIAYLPESLAAPGGVTVGQLVRIGANLTGLRADAARKAAGAAIRITRLESLEARKISHLSRGQAKLAGLAYALSGGPVLLLLDEPESGLDPASRIALRTAVREVVIRGSTVLVSSHDLGELEKVAERLLVLEDGRISREVRAPWRHDLETLLLGDRGGASGLPERSA